MIRIILIIFIFISIKSIYSIPSGLFFLLSEKEYTEKLTVKNLTDIQFHLRKLYISNSEDLRSYFRFTSERDPKDPYDYSLNYKRCNPPGENYCHYSQEANLWKDGSYVTFEILNKNLIKATLFDKPLNKYTTSAYFLRIEDINIVKQYLEFCQLENKFSLYELGYPDPRAHLLYRVDARPYLQIYKKPSLTGGYVTVVDLNSSVYVLETIPGEPFAMPNDARKIKGNWVKIETLSGQVGYASNVDLSKYKESDGPNSTDNHNQKNTEPNIFKPTHKVTASALNVRSSASTTASIVTTAPRNSTVQVIEETNITLTVEGKSGKWVKIRLADRKEGFVFNGFLELIK